jgi:iron complex transport system permease protein
VTDATIVAMGPWSVRMHRRTIVAGLGILAALVVALVATLSLGGYSVPIPRVLAAVFGQGSPADELIVAQLRLPRALAAALVGMALGLAGSIFQSVTRNPLGSPDVIGFDTGSATGALVAMLLLHGGIAATSIGAVAGGAVTAVLVFVLAARNGIAPLRLVLVGIGAGALLAAVNSLLIVRAQVYDAQSASTWLVGNLAGRGWPNVALLAPVVVLGAILALLLARPLTLAEFADERSTSLGLHPGRLRVAAIALAVVLASGAVATAGPILFIALAAPQVARRLTRAPGPNLIASGLVGGVLLVCADLAARESFQPRQLPVGVLTGVVGGIYLIWLLGREWRKGRG